MKALKSTFTWTEPIFTDPVPPHEPSTPHRLGRPLGRPLRRRVVDDPTDGGHRYTRWPQRTDVRRHDPEGERKLARPPFIRTKRAFGPATGGDGAGEPSPDQPEDDRPDRNQEPGSASPSDRGLGTEPASTRSGEPRREPTPRLGRSTSARAVVGRLLAGSFGLPPRGDDPTRTDPGAQALESSALVPDPRARTATREGEPKDERRGASPTPGGNSRCRSSRVNVVRRGARGRPFGARAPSVDEAQPMAQPATGEVSTTGRQLNPQARAMPRNADGSSHLPRISSGGDAGVGPAPTVGQPQVSAGAHRSDRRRGAAHSHGDGAEILTDPSGVPMQSRSGDLS
jgi:hypothetical protein